MTDRQLVDEYAAEADRLRKHIRELRDRKSNFEMVREFHEAFGIPILDKPVTPDYDRLRLRSSLVREELHEFHEAIDWPRLSLSMVNLVAVADALADLLYVIYGTGLEFGIDLDRVFAEVHRSNMTKLGADGKPIYREDGKILKGPSYEQPKIKEILDVANS